MYKGSATTYSLEGGHEHWEEACEAHEQDEAVLSGSVEQVVGGDGLEHLGHHAVCARSLVGIGSAGQQRRGCKAEAEAECVCVCVNALAWMVQWATCAVLPRKYGFKSLSRCPVVMPAAIMGTSESASVMGSPHEMWSTRGCKWLI